MATTLDLSIAIVSYNTQTLLFDCLKSVFESTGSIKHEVIVVDNNSQDGTVDAVRRQYPCVQFIRNSENRGFSKAVNQALTVSRGRFFLMLNSDTRVQDHALERMLACLDQEPDIGAVGCKQWTEDGRMYQSCFPFPSVRDHLTYAALFQKCAPGVQRVLAGRYAIDCAKSQDVDWINGACLMVRRDLLKACGGLDEGYFMYFEDVDLCRTIRQRGFRIRHLAEADVIHLIGRSGKGNRDQLNLVWEFSRIRYVDKHFSWFAGRIMKAWIVTGAIVRLIGAVTPFRSNPNDASCGHALLILHRVLIGARQPETQIAWAGEGKG